MPNWVRNKLTIDDENYEKIVESICNEDSKLDFEKIVPMPESLKITSGSITQKSLDAFMHSIENSAEYRVYENLLYEHKYKARRMTNEEFEDFIETTIGDHVFFDDNKALNSKDEVLSFGKQVADNLIKYGCMDWYDWSIAHWGTKWNADTIEISENTILFETAWSPPIQAMQELTRKYPKAVFTLDFSDEQICVDCGYIIFTNKQIKDYKKYPDFSKLAYEHGFELWPGCKKSFRFNKKVNTYEFIEDEMR